jgi:hypothetical protein
VEFEGEDPTAAGGNALETAAWAAKRLRLPIGVAAAPRGRAEKVRDALVEAGVQARIVPGGRNGAVELQWLMPGQGEP